MKRRTINEIQSLIPPCHYSVHVGLLSTPRHLELFNVDLNPDYQRGHVWTPEQQSKFVGAMIEDHEQINPIILNDVDRVTLNKTEVVDGKQRITAILAWIEGEINALCPCGDEVSHDSLDKIEKRALGMATTIQWRVVRLDRKGVLDYYLRLNSGGTVHTQEELNRVRGMLEEEK